MAKTSSPVTTQQIENKQAERANAPEWAGHTIKTWKYLTYRLQRVRFAFASNELWSPERYEGILA